jgi:transposase
MNGKLLHFYYSYLWGFDTADRLDAADKDLAVLEQRIQEKLKPYEAQLTLLDGIPGVDWSVTAAIIAELGVDMSVFQNVLQATSWAGE